VLLGHPQRPERNVHGRRRRGLSSPQPQVHGAARLSGRPHQPEGSRSRDGEGGKSGIPEENRRSLGKGGADIGRGSKGQQEIGEAGALLQRGKRSYEFVGQAKGIHNADLAGVILEQAQKDARKAEELLASSGMKCSV